MNTIVLNLYAGPGAGKSVLAAELFAELKKQDKSVELVREWVKKWAWENYPIKGWADNIYIFGKQLRAESTLYGKVEYLVTDSPLGLPMAYERMYCPDQYLIHDNYQAVRKLQETDGIVTNLNFHLMRQHEYQTAGRYETEDQARKVDNIIRNLVPGHMVKCAKDVLEVLVHHKRDFK